MFRFGWTLVLIYFYLTHTSSGFGRSFTQMDIIISLVPRLPSLRLSVRVCCEVMADKSLDWIYQKLLWRFIPPHFAISPGNFFFAPSRYGKLLIFHLHSFIIFLCYMYSGIFWRFERSASVDCLPKMLNARRTKSVLKAFTCYFFFFLRWSWFFLLFLALLRFLAVLLLLLLLILIIQKPRNITF